MRYPRLANDSFFHLSVPDAIKKYLIIARRPATPKDITMALNVGGLTHQAKNLYQTVYPTLLRMDSEHKEFEEHSSGRRRARWLGAGYVR